MMVRLLLGRVRLLALLVVAAAAAPGSAHAAQFADISSGGRATCATTASGTLYCWGDGREGQLGRIALPAARVPTRVIGTFDSVQVSAGTDYACQILARGKQVETTGIFACWGANTFGQLGDGREQRALFPQEVRSPGLLTQIDAGPTAVCAIGQGGGAWCWGENRVGQLGDGSENQISRVPKQVAGVSGLVDIAVGDSHVCGARSDGQLICWGWTRGGRTSVQIGPIVVATAVPGLTDVTAVAAGSSHTCVIRRTGGGTVWCFGLDDRGQLGLGAPRGEVTVATQVPGLTGVQRIDASLLTTCAIDTAGRVWCWGKGSTGQIGNGRRADTATPTPVSDLRDVRQVSVGDNHVCALTRRGAPYCWGSNRYGQLGNGDRTGLGVRVLTPKRVVDQPLGRATFVPRALQSFPTGTAGGTIELRNLIVRKSRSARACPRGAAIRIRAGGKVVTRTVTSVTRRSPTACRVSGTFALPANTTGATRTSYRVFGSNLRSVTDSLRAQRAG